MPTRRRTVAALTSPTGMSSAVVVVALVALALVAPLVWSGRAQATDVAHLLEGSSSQHLLGTDNLGRDMLFRTLVATRLSLLLAVLTVLLAVGIGVPLGALPTVLGRRAARATTAVIEFALAFPGLLLAIFLAVILGVGAHAAVLALGIASAPAFARLTQTLAASVAGSDYVAAARVLGLSRSRILFHHVLPNVAEPIILNTTIAVGYALLAMSGLSFLGLGVQPPSYDWGRLLDESLDRIYVTPEASLGPCIAILIAGVAFNGLGEATASAAGTRGPSVRRRGSRVSPTKAPGHQQAGPGRDAVARHEQVPATLVVEGLTVSFPAAQGPITPVRGISFTVAAGERLGIVGESASGKSLTALSLAGLVPHPGEVNADRIEFLGNDLYRMRSADRNRLLGTSLAMVFQDPATSLNPALRIGTQLAEVAEVHDRARRRAAMRRAVDRLRSVRLSSPQRRLKQYPHELSGGMRQRVMIAAGLMGNPRLVVADEPTSALDVTVQQQILRLLREVGDETAASCIMITHDIAVVTELCDRVLVMYAGRIVEDLDITVLRAGPAHPYTRALLAAVPDLETDRAAPLATIPGRPPDVADLPPGCPFAPRCPAATDRCRVERPPFESDDGGPHRVACWHPQEGPVLGLERSAVSDQ